MASRSAYAYAGALALAALAGIGYMFARDYVAGYLDMTNWANPNIITNYTVGFFLLFFLVGITAGEMADMAMRLLKVKWSKETKFMAIGISGFLGAIVFGQLISAVGWMPGSRFA